MTYPKLFVTFVKPEDVEQTLAYLSEKYILPNRKLWILESPDTTENLITYNVVEGTQLRLPHTLIVHRQKNTNTLYTINGLNALVESITGYRDPNYKIDWSEYKHYYIGSQAGKLQLFRTHIKEVVEY